MFASELKMVLVPGLLFAFCASQAAYGFDVKDQAIPSIHEQITKEGLDHNLCQSNLEIVVLGSDLKSYTAGNSNGDKYQHFQDKNLLKTLNYVEREKRKVLNFCATADVDQKSRVRALYHFGLILHTLQDFYSNTNYLELKLAQLGKQPAPAVIPLVDWSTFLSILRSGEKTSILVEGFDKGDPRDSEAALSTNGATYFSLARELAVRETERQWQQLESLIKAKWQGNATAITVSLKDAGCPGQIVSDVLKNGDSLVPEI